MATLPQCDFNFGDIVVVRSTSEYAEDFPETFHITGLSWQFGRTFPLGDEVVNITLTPTDGLRDAGSDGFTDEELRLATESEIAANRRGPE